MESDSSVLENPMQKKAGLMKSLIPEYQFLKVPFQQYHNTIMANRCFFNKEICKALATIDDIGEFDVAGRLSDVVWKLKTDIKRKLEEGSVAAELQEKRIQARINHLEEAYLKNFSEWNDVHVNRLLVDYMLHCSYNGTAKKLTESTDIQYLVDIEVFDEATKVIKALQNKNTVPALAWCADHKSRLKKSKRVFEFQLRCLELIERVQVGDSNGVNNWSIFSDHMTELEHLMRTLDLKNNAGYYIYKDLFEPKKWDNLVEQFKEEFRKIYKLSTEPLLNIYLLSGLFALKTPSCNENDCLEKDPLSQESYRKLAQPLPFRKLYSSQIVCYITKEAMHLKNPPLALPNGYVYSSKALEDMALKNNGRITCPRTGFVCNSCDLMAISVVNL